MIKKTRGFTLIELMIVVAVLSIIVAVGYPSYMEHVKKSRRAEGMGQLLELADRMERAYSDRGTYPTNISEVYVATTTDGGFYTLTVVSANNVSFTVSAAPTSLGGQNDDKCETFTLTSLGQKSISGSVPNSQCWK
jgi:type IV pilus assembly protein PilE